MRSEDIGDVLVADDWRVVGVLTDRDITVRAAAAEGVDPLTVPAEAVCTPHPVAVGPDDPPVLDAVPDAVPDAVGLTREHAVRRLPVVEDGRPVGFVIPGDLAVARDRDSAPADTSRADPGGRRRA
jgi:CBS domain-containing protein